MKCNQSRLGFKLVSPCPFPMRITISSRAPPHFHYYCIRRIYNSMSTVLDTFIYILQRKSFFISHELLKFQSDLCLCRFRNLKQNVLHFVKSIDVPPQLFDLVWFGFFVKWCIHLHGLFKAISDLVEEE